MKKFTPLYILMVLCFCSLSSYGQNSFPASGTVGIGTLNPDPNYALDVNGALNVSEILVTELNVTDLFVNGSPVQSSPWDLNGNNAFYSSGNVGIGTNNPGYTLDVSGTINATSILLNGTPLEGSSSPWTVSGSDISYTAGDVGVQSLTATSILLDGTPLENSPSPWSTSGSNISYTDGEVNVATLTAMNINLNGSTLVSSPWTIAENDLSYTAGTIGVETLDASTLRINGTDVVSSPWTIAGSDISFTTGNIGIGTPTPDYALDVAGTLNATNILIDGTPLEGSSSPWTIAGSDISYTDGEVDVTTLNATNINLNGSTLVSSQWASSGADLSYTTGNIGIGTNNTQGYMLAVAGNIVAEGVKVELAVNWPDFVFEKDFDLLSLKDIESYINKNGHLPNVPSAEEVKRNGISLGEMDATLLQKIEELTLHSIQQQKEIDSLKILNEKLVNQNKLIQSLEKRLLKIESKEKQ